MHITPEGNFIYASVRSTDTIAGFRIDPQSGLLSPIGLFAAEGSPRGFAIEPSGRFLICAGQSRHTVGIYAIDPDGGALTLQWRIPVGANPNWVETLALPISQ